MITLHLIIGLIVYFITKAKYGDKIENFKNDYYIGDKCISLYVSKGFEDFEIAGLQHHIAWWNVGAFDGHNAYIQHQADNAYDPHAMAIYVNEHLIGFVPKKCSKKLHDKLGEKRAECYGYTACNDKSGWFYGGVCVNVENTYKRGIRTYGETEYMNI